MTSGVWWCAFSRCVGGALLLRLLLMYLANRRREKVCQQPKKALKREARVAVCKEGRLHTKPASCADKLTQGIAIARPQRADHSEVDRDGWSAQLLRRCGCTALVVVRSGGRWWSVSLLLVIIVVVELHHARCTALDCRSGGCGGGSHESNRRLTITTISIVLVKDRVRVG